MSFADWYLILKRFEARIHLLNCLLLSKENVLIAYLLLYLGEGHEIFFFVAYLFIFFFSIKSPNYSWSQKPHQIIFVTHPISIHSFQNSNWTSWYTYYVSIHKTSLSPFHMEIFSDFYSLYVYWKLNLILKLIYHYL